jgi:hypothetical protein
MPEAAPGTPSGLEAELAAAFDAFEILSPTSFSFAGEPPVDAASAAAGPGWGAPGLAAPHEANTAELLQRAIQAALYDRCYSHRLGAARETSDSAPAEDPAFLRRLIEANAGRERWDPGWVVQQFGQNGQAYVRKGERERIAMPGAFISDAMPGMATQIGASLRLRAPREATGIQPGYYFAFGETLDEPAEQLSLVRLYFHCGAEEAPALLAALTSPLNRFQIPFQLKAPANPAFYGRTDAVVLYAGARYFFIVVQIIAAVRERVALDPSVPLFTKPLWPGIGVAVEPDTGESFGAHRCRLAAEGIVAAWGAGRQDTPGRLAAVAKRFAAAGLDLARPYLGPGWVDLFAPPAPPRLP